MGNLPLVEVLSINCAMRQQNIKEISYTLGVFKNIFIWAFMKLNEKFNGLTAFPLLCTVRHKYWCTKKELL